MAKWQPCNYALADETEARAWAKEGNAKHPGAFRVRQRSKKRWVGLVDYSKVEIPKRRKV